MLKKPQQNTPPKKTQNKMIETNPKNKQQKKQKEKKNPAEQMKYQIHNCAHT